MNAIRRPLVRTHASTLTIAYVAIGVHNALRRPANESARNDSSEMDFIEVVCDEALLLDRIADFIDQLDGHPAVFAFEVAEPFGDAYATAIFRDRAQASALDILREVMLSAKYDSEELDQALSSIAHVDLRAAKFAKAPAVALMPPLMNERYASQVIGRRAADFDALEIQGVRESGDDTDADRVCTVDKVCPQFFSVYARLKPEGEDRGVSCVGDFGSYMLARAYAEELAQQHGWPVTDFVPAQFRR